jgi:hypothetical protein
MQLPAFTDAEASRGALASASIVSRRSSPLVHLISRCATWRKRLGWSPV